MNSSSNVGRGWIAQAQPQLGARRWLHPKRLWKLQSFEFRFTLPKKRLVGFNLRICLETADVFFCLWKDIHALNWLNTISLLKQIILRSLEFDVSFTTQKPPITPWRSWNSLQGIRPWSLPPWIRDFVKMEIDTKLVSDWRVDETKLNAKASFEWNSC